MAAAGITNPNQDPLCTTLWEGRQEWRPGDSGPPQYCVPSVTVPDVLGEETVWLLSAHALCSFW